jgi:hypothetical protein
VAPTAAEYRQLGANEPFLAALRTATGGSEVVTPLDPWRHDLTATSRFTDLWPWLLVLALILWPLDIALRRVSIGRREMVAARSWVTGWRGRRRAPAARTATGAGLFAARERASSMEARAAMRRTDEPAGVAGAAGSVAAAAPVAGRPTDVMGAATTSAPAAVSSTGAAASAAPLASPAPAAARPVPPTPPPAPRPTPPAPTAAATPTAPAPRTAEADPSDTMARLREAKRRAQER